MEILVIRHAQAVDHAQPIEDAYRPLTAQGRKQARQLGRALRDLDERPDAIITSPLVRAVQTAELVAGRLRFKDQIEVAPELIPSRDPGSLVEEVLLPRADLQLVVIVGHEPLLGLLLRQLLQLPVPSPAKASAVRLSWVGPEHPARFRWVLKPGLDAPSEDPYAIG